MLSEKDTTPEKDTTRISDLPSSNYKDTVEINSNNNSNISSSLSPSLKPFKFLDVISMGRSPKLSDDLNTTYKPMNNIPNPYLPSNNSDETFNNLFANESSISQYTQDLKTVVNYIPPSQIKIKDYIEKQEKLSVHQAKKHQGRVRRNHELMDMVGEIQFSIFISLIFMIFQFPVINTMIMQIPYAMELLFYRDGNINLWGIIAKSISFGIIYFFIQYIGNSLVLI